VTNAVEKRRSSRELTEDQMPVFEKKFSPGLPQVFAKRIATISARSLGCGNCSLGEAITVGFILSPRWPQDESPVGTHSSPVHSSPPARRGNASKSSDRHHRCIVRRRRPVSLPDEHRHITSHQPQRRDRALPNHPVCCRKYS
jgi:hypothetical protein